VQIELRPLSTGEMLDRTFQLYRARFGMFVGLATVAAAIQTLGGTVQVLLLHFLAVGGHHAVLARVFTTLGVLISIGIALLANSVVFAAITRSVSALYLEQPTGIALAYREVWPRWFRYVRVALAAGFLSTWPVLPFVAALVAEVALIPIRAGGAAAPRAVVVGLTGLGAFLVVPVCIWLLCRYALSIVACVVEALPVWRSIRRSVALSKGLRGRVFVLLLLIYIFQLILALAFSAPILGRVIHSGAHVPLGVSLYQLVAGFIVTALVSGLYGIGLTVIYLDARTRKEGFDIELMMGRTGIATPARAAVLPIG
jgi:hypothetical protein